MLQRVVPEHSLITQVPSGRPVWQQKDRRFLRIRRHLDNRTNPSWHEPIWGLVATLNIHKHHIHVTLEADIDVKALLVNSGIGNVRAWEVAEPFLRDGIMAKSHWFEALGDTKAVALSADANVEDGVKGSVGSNIPDVPDAGADFPLCARKIVEWLWME
jgi:hypothetical protein